MKSIEELLAEILELGDGWTLKDIQVDRRLKEIDIFIEYINSRGYFPETKELLSVYDYGKPRRIRHLDLFEYKCYLNTRIPRVKHDKSYQTLILYRPNII